MEKLLSRSIPLYIVMGIVSFFLAFSFFGFAANKAFKDGYLPPKSVVKLYDTLGAAPIELAKGVLQIFSHRSLVPSRFSQAGFSGSSQADDSTYGYLLLSRFDEASNQAVVDFIDLSSLETIHSWKYIAEDLWSTLNYFPNQASLQQDKNRLGMRMMHPLALEDGSLVFQDHSPLIKINRCSELDWVNADYEFHHSLEVDYEGNYWIPSRVFNSETQLVTYQGNEDLFRDEGIALVSPDGEVLMEKNLIEIFEENGLDAFIYGMGYGHLGSRHHDPLHINDIEPVLQDGEFWNKGDVFLSFRHRSMVMLYRPETNAVIWYKVGPWIHQHDVDISGPNQISIFNNNAFDPLTPEAVVNDVIIYDFSTNAVSQPYLEAFEMNEIRTFYEGRSQLMDNGQVFVEETNHGRALVLNEDGSVVWSFVNKANDDDEMVGVLGWSRLVPHALGDAIVEATSVACPT